MNAAAGKTPTYFMYYPGHCRRDYLTLACDVLGDWLEEKLKRVTK